MKKKIIIACAGLVLFFVVCGVLLHQSPEKTYEIYKSALKDYNEGRYQNSYYLFSKVSIFSNLKPIAIYHRAECAKMLGDDKSELRQYQILFNNYPKNKLSIKSKYLAGQKLVEEKPSIAKKYFESVIKQAPNSDYAIASEYYLGLILKNKYNNKSLPKSVKIDVENHFRHYLKQAPAGKHAYNAVKNWLELSDDIEKDDYLLMAKTCYLFGEYDKTDELLTKANIADSWVLRAKNAYALKNNQKVKNLVESGLQNYSKNVSDDEVIEAIDLYKEVSDSSYIEKLSAFANGKGQDYLTYLKCQKVPQENKLACFSDLYLKYPNGKFSADALSNIFFAKIKAGDLTNAKKIGKDYLNKFPKTNSTPMVMFWLGKIYEKTKNYDEYNNYYKKVIETFPDSYYAYRAYINLKRYKSSIITSNINLKKVIYPYEYSKNNVIIKLIILQDYDVINELADGDEFVKSWVLYKKGDYPASIVMARNAMEKIDKKPPKYDLRWRLIYPIIYYNDIKKYANETGNNVPLILSIIREESFFDPLAQSPAGASGLMQLMPSTAQEINAKYLTDFNVKNDLFNKEKNLKLGNYYYGFLKSRLNGLDISAVAAYNGGIGSINSWKNSIYYNDTDEFVEQIPYPETKNYVKKVFRSYWNYIRLYSGN